MDILKSGRIVDEETYDKVKAGECEVCGSLCDCGPHHITPRGAGGDDVEENLIQLCPTCHMKAHSGLIDREWLRKIAARRINNQRLFGGSLW